MRNLLLIGLLCLAPTAALAITAESMEMNGPIHTKASPAERVWRGKFRSSELQVRLVQFGDRGIGVEDQLLITSAEPDLNWLYRVTIHPIPDPLGDLCHARQLVCRAASGSLDPTARLYPTIAAIRDDGSLLLFYVGRYILDVTILQEDKP